MTEIVFWTVDRVESLRTLYAEGFSCSTIAAKIGGTRNAVIGKIHRLKLPAPVHKKAGPPKVKAVPRYTRSVIKIERANANGGFRFMEKFERDQHKLRCVEIIQRNLTTQEINLGAECEWIQGDDHLHCGHPVKPGSSYCVPHHALCWVAPKVFTDKTMIREVA